VIELHTFGDPDSQAGALADAVALALLQALPQTEVLSAAVVNSAAAVAPPRTLAVSGGTSPRRFFEHLSRRALDWSTLDVTLVDDRWVPDDDGASNAALVRATLLQQGATAGRFLPLVDVAQSPEAQVARLNRDPRYRQPEVVVLGMGEDGHTASLFADAPEWDAALSTTERYVLVHPVAAPHARVSLSLHALVHTRRLFLLISGARKLEVLNQAVAGPNNNAISKLANHKGVQIDVYWCAD
jgi:6-phosphogluconolactonase